MNIVKHYYPEIIEADRNAIAQILLYKAENGDESTIADYLAKSDDALQALIDRTTQSIKEAQEYKKILEGQREIIKAEAANFLLSNGVNRLDSETSTDVSSITTTTPKPTETVIIKDEAQAIESGFYQKVIDKTALKEALQDGLECDYATLEVVHNEPKIKINKKR